MLMEPGTSGARTHAQTLWRSAMRQALRFRKAEEAAQSWVDLDVQSEACVRLDYDAGARHSAAALPACACPCARACRPASRLGGAAGAALAGALFRNPDAPVACSQQELVGDAHESEDANHCVR